MLVGKDGRVRVADFGVARYRDPDEAAWAENGALRMMATVAGRGARIGTPAYMAPEQHENEGVGPPSDQFSFYCTWPLCLPRASFPSDANARNCI